MKSWKPAVLALLLTAGCDLTHADDGNWFVGYELLEMSMNEFSNFAGEVGYRFDRKSAMRLTIMEVELTERHLSSDYEAYAVDGENVEGYLRGYELHYDRFFSKSWYYSLNIGYYNDTYEHINLNEKIENHTSTIGVGIGFRKDDLFGKDKGYLNFNMPFRYYFNSIEETKMGDTIIREHSLVNNVWLFFGYDFN